MSSTASCMALRRAFSAVSVVEPCELKNNISARLISEFLNRTPHVSSWTHLFQDCFARHVLALLRDSRHPGVYQVERKCLVEASDYIVVHGRYTVRLSYRFLTGHNRCDPCLVSCCSSMLLPGFPGGNTGSISLAYGFVQWDSFEPVLSPFRRLITETSWSNQIIAGISVSLNCKVPERPLHPRVLANGLLEILL
jgi:hypothetical protein